MIKMNYGNTRHREALKKAYVKIIPDRTLRQTRWVALRKQLVGIDGRFKNLLPSKYNKLLVADFETLADIYELYVSLKVKKLHNALHEDAKALFSYGEKITRWGHDWESLQPVIATFFMNEHNGLEIHTCHYCDMAYVNPFTFQTGKKAQFDLDHVLQKAKCPLVALSLFNFVPSCQMCNGSRIKGQRELYSDARIRKKLSPTNEDYDFEGKVRIEVVNKKGECSTIGFERRMADYEIRFNTHLDPDYAEEVKEFYLEERYNYHKCEALRLLDLMERYTDAHIMELARMILQSPKTKVSAHGTRYITQLKQDIFASNYNHRFHRCFGKLYDDIMK